MVLLTEAAKRRGKYPPLATDTNNCFGIYQNSEIIEHKNDGGNSFTANDYNFGAEWPNVRGRRFFLPKTETFEGICLALAGKFL